MRKAYKIMALWFLFTALFSGSVYALGNVPKSVLSLRKSVVRIICNTTDGVYTGSGFAIGKSEPIEYIVTNFHVVEKNTDELYILRDKGERVKASIAIQMPEADLCVLKLSEQLYLPPIALLEDGNASVGDNIFTLGFPAAADLLSDSMTGNPEDITITEGIISSIKKLTVVEGGASVKLFQIDAAVSPGNSGGPLVNEDGIVVGVNTYSVRESQNINGSICISELYGALKNHGIPYLAAKSGETSYLLIILSSAAIIVILITGLIFLIRIMHKNKESRPKHYSGNNAALDRYLIKLGGKLPEFTAIRLMGPVINDITHLHKEGVSFQHISPYTILVDNAAHGLLDYGNLSKKLYYGYSAPEQYSVDGRVGPWSDIYSISAVLFRILSGIDPQGHAERVLGDNLIKSRLDESNTSEVLSTAIQKGLSIDPSQRQQNIMAFLSDLGEAYKDVLISPVENTRPQLVCSPSPESAVILVQRPNRKRLKTLLVSIIVPLLLVGSVYSFAVLKYNEACRLIDRGEYKAAQKELAILPDFFSSTKSLKAFAQAGTLLVDGKYDEAISSFRALNGQWGAEEKVKEAEFQQALSYLSSRKFAEARNIFSSLGSFKDSATYIKEVDYQNAVETLKSGKYSSAESMFAKLEKAKYKDSSELRKEALYQIALDLYKKKDLLNAYKQINALIPYKDSKDVLGSIIADMYDQAVKYYREENLSSAKNYFEKISGYGESQSYLAVIECIDNQIQGILNHSYGEELFRKLSMLSGFEDVDEIRESDAYLYFRLEGSWRDNNGNYFNLMYSGDTWNTTYNLPYLTGGKYFKLENKACYIGSDEKGWRKMYYFSFTSENTMQVYCQKNGRVYSLTRR